MTNPPRVGIQGELGAFSQEAALQLLGDTIQVTPFPRFDEVFAAIGDGRADAAVIPIENTLHGSVHENYDHLLRHQYRIVGETNVRIVHHLIANPSVKFKDIRRVFSHPVALNQCLDFFARNPEIERVPFYDTAGSVRMVIADGLRDAGAIASQAAAVIYGGTILKKSIEDDRRNFTRFFLLNGDRAIAPLANEAGPWKTSVVFTTRNIPGALFRALSAFALRDLSLTKIESRPLRGKPWEYLFYVDFLGREDEPKVRNALAHLQEFSDLLRILGTYPKG